MSRSTDETHDPVQRSWVESANDPNDRLSAAESAVVRSSETRVTDGPSIGVGIGDFILNCCVIAEQRCLSRLNHHAIAPDVEQRLAWGTAERCHVARALSTASGIAAGAV